MLNGNTMAAAFVLVAQGAPSGNQAVGEYAVVLAALVIVANFAWMVIKAMKEHRTGDNGKPGLTKACQRHGERLAGLEARVEHMGDNVEKLYGHVDKLFDIVQRKG